MRPLSQMRLPGLEDSAGVDDVTSATIPVTDKLRRANSERARAAWAKRRANTAPTPVASTPEDGSSNLADLPEGRVAHWSKEDLAIFASAGLALIMGVTVLAGSKLHLPELASTPEEATAIAGPLTRLVARRVKVPAAMRGDAADAMALASALSAYIIRVYAVIGTRAREDRERRSNAVYNPAAGPTNGSTTPAGPDTISYFPPANRAPGGAT